MNINDVCYGFKLLRQEKIDECSSDAFLFEHEKSGAKLLFIKNDDDNKVFSVAFRTPPADDTGVPHIIEHSTLCGSRKFPLKEPFVELIKGSLNTFLNAMTYPDKTLYPIASRNNKDFHNLMDVYLDAVFYPSIYKKPEVFLQEGWHYELEDADAPLEYSGVVYNEMKGALSNPSSQLSSKLMQTMFPNSIYSKESGGDPEFITDLTYEQFIDFHKKYYSPANSYIYLYGDMDIEEQLKFIDEEYLSHFDRVEVDSRILLQKPFSEIQNVEADYSVGADEDTAEKTFLNYASIIGDGASDEDNAAMSILSEALFQNEAGPIRQALINAKLGKDVDSDFESSIMQPMISITISGSEADRLEQFKKVLFDSVREQIDKGIDKELLEATINQREFRLREADFSRSPKGLVYNIMILTSWLYDRDPFTPLRYEKILKISREGLKTDFYEKMLKRYVLDNKHSAFVTMKPSQTLATEKAKKEKEKLARIKEKMSVADVEAVMATANKLKEMQAEPDSPEALATIPLLEIKDIDPEPIKLPIAEKVVDGVKVLHSDIDTNGIVYMTLCFDLKKIPQDLLPYAFLLTDFMRELNTKNYTYQSLENAINMNTGGIACDIETTLNKACQDGYNAYFLVSAKCFKRNLSVTNDLMSEIINTTTYTDKKRIKEILLSMSTTIEQSILHSPIQVMFSELSKGMDISEAINDYNYLPKYNFIKEILKDFENNFADFSKKLSETAGILFNKKDMLVNVVLKNDGYALFEQELQKLLATLGDREYPTNKYNFAYGNTKKALSSVSSVQYVGKGANLAKLGYDELPGYLRILEGILRYEYFWIRIRVQGGAYGAMVRLYHKGIIEFASYRDPNLAETLKVFDETAEYIRNFNADEREMTKYIIGAISAIEPVLTPRTRGLTAFVDWLAGRTYEQRKKRRSEILNAKVEDIRSLAKYIDLAMKEDNICVFGNEEKIAENKDLFDTITNVID